MEEEHRMKAGEEMHHESADSQKKPQLREADMSGEKKYNKCSNSSGFLNK